MRYHPREITRRIVQALDSMPVVVLTGMRQVGKTTLIHTEPALAHRRYLDLDDFATAESARSSPEELLSSSEPITLDEVQRAPSLLRSIKQQVDQDRAPGRFLLSGSANLLLHQGVTESLAGRAVFLTLGPMTRREILGATAPPFLVDLLQGRNPLPGEGLHPAVSAKQILVGGMPPVALRDADPAIWFRGFEQTYLERDVRDMARIADLGAFRRFLRLIALRTGTVMNLTGVAEDAGVSTATAARYLGILEASYGVQRLPPFTATRVSRLVKSPKIFTTDSGIANHLIGPRPAPLEATDRHRGALLETYVAQNLAALLEAWLPEASLHYFRVHGRHEVDFIVEWGDALVALEVKAGSRWSPRDLRGLRRFLDKTPGCVAGLLACGVRQAAPVGDKLWAVPLGQVLG